MAKRRRLALLRLSSQKFLKVVHRRQLHRWSFVKDAGDGFFFLTQYVFRQSFFHSVSCDSSRKSSACINIRCYLLSIDWSSSFVAKQLYVQKVVIIKKNVGISSCTMSILLMCHIDAMYIENPCEDGFQDFFLNI